MEEIEGHVQQFKELRKQESSAAQQCAGGTQSKLDTFLQHDTGAGKTNVLQSCIV